MNRLCYRIVFNQARQMLMVVSELARATGGADSRSAGNGITVRNSALRPLALALWLAAGWISFPAAASTITGDRGAPAGQRPTVLDASNGVVQVNIQTPDKQGLSHNKYTQFDVDAHGAVLNNSQHNTHSQLAGMVAGNPWLAKGSAKVILNEINGRAPSQLKGFVEVAGQKADVIIANPSGITCSGCGFINAGRSTLAAGRPKIINGQVAGFDIDRGRITVEGQGFNGNAQDYTHLIARAVEVNARLQAQDLTVTLGRNQTDADGNIVQVKADDKAGRPKFALDVAALGGMYANKITLTGTEQGVGVRNAGELGASQGALSLNINGKLTNSGKIYSQQDFPLQTAGLDNRGQIASGSSLKVVNQGELTNGGQFTAQRDITLNASGQLHNTDSGQIVAGANVAIASQTLLGDKGSIIGAGIDAAGKASQTGSMTLTTVGQLESHGEHLSHDAIAMTGSKINISASHNQSKGMALTARSGDITTHGSQINTDDFHAATPGKFSNRQGIISAGQIAVNAPSAIDNTQGILAQRGSSTLKLNSAQIDNTRGSLTTGGALELSTPQLINADGELGSVGGDVTIDAAALRGDKGKIVAAEQLTLSGKQLSLNGALTQGRQVALSADSLVHQGGKLLQTGSGLAQVTVSGEFDNQQGEIISQGALNLLSQNFHNQQGLVSAAGGSANITVEKALDNQQGRIESAGNVNLKTADLDNRGGSVVAAGGDNQLIVSNSLNNDAGKVLAARNLTLSSPSLSNIEGTISALSGAGSLTVTGAIDNQKGIIEGHSALTASAASVNNQGGRMASAGNLTLTASGEVNNANTLTDGQGVIAGGLLNLHSDAMNNQSGRLMGGDLLLSAGQLTNENGEISASTTLTLDAQSLDNRQGLISAQQGSARLTVAQVVDNRSGTLQSGAQLAVTAQSLNNRDGKLLAAAGDLSGQFTRDVNNQRGKIISGGSIALNGQALDNRDGTISAAGGNGLLQFSHTINNQHGNIESARGLTLTGTELDNSAGRLLAAGGEATLTLSDALNNTDGVINSTGKLALESQSVTNLRGQISGNSLALSTHSLDNSHGLLQASGDMALDTHGSALNNAGTLADNAGIRVGGNLDLSAGDVDNRSGLIGAGSLRIEGATLQNQGGEISSQLDATLIATALVNSDGLISVRDGQLGLTISEMLDNQSGTLQSGGSLAIKAGNLDNQSGTVLAAAGNAGITIAGTINNQHGQLAGRDNLTLNASALDNANGLVAALNGATDVRVNGQLTNQQGSIEAGKGLTLSADTLDNVTGNLVAAGGDSHIDITHTLNNTGGRIASQGATQLVADRLDNSDGTITGVQGDIEAVVRQDVINQHGVIQSGNGVTLTASQLDNREGTVLAAGAALNLGLTHTLDNRDGKLQAQQDITLQSASFNNQNGRVSSVKGSLNSRVDGALDNQQGTLESNDTLIINAGRIDNSNGTLLSANQNVQAHSDGALINQDGRIAAQQNVTLESASLDNQKGTLTAVSGHLSIAVLQAVQNGEGVMQSGGVLTIQGATLDNHSGIIQSTTADVAVTLSQTLDNQKGQISAKQALTLQAGSVDNRQGVMLGERMTADTQGLDNRGGLIQGTQGLTLDTHDQLLQNGETNTGTTGLRTGGKLTVKSGQLANDNGIIAAQNIDIFSAALSNQQGHITSVEAAKLVTQALDNSLGQIQAGGALHLNTQQQTLTNSGGTLQTNGALDIQASLINNTSGVMQGNNGLMLNATTVTNDRGKILSGDALTLTVSELDNRNGELFAATDGVLKIKNTLQNEGGFIKSNDGLTINAATVDNQNTRAAGQGIEAGSLTITANRLNNVNGALRAANLLQANISKNLNNQQGLISSQGTLGIGQTGSSALTLKNNEGEIVAGDSATLNLGSLKGVGRITSGGDLALNTADALIQDGTLASHGNLSLNTGNLTNKGLISAGQQLQLISGALINQANGEISASSVDVHASSIVNRGLFDGSAVKITTADLHNTGSGRIYGDDLTIDARTLLNDKSQGSAATIAGRHSVTIATDSLTNSNHGLIYSDGDLSIGKSLNADGSVSGQAATVNNHSATMESMGELKIAAQNIDNRDINLKLSEAPEEVGTPTQTVDFQFCEGNHDKVLCKGGDGKRYHFPVKYNKKTKRYDLVFDKEGKSHALDENGNSIKDIYIGMEDGHRAGKLRWALPPYGSSKHYIQYEYQTHTAETKIISSDAAVMRSGKDLILNGNLTNQDSKVVAGNTLAVNGAVSNLESSGTRHIWDEGQRISWYRHNKGGADWKQKSNTQIYQGQDVTETLALHLMEYVNNAGQAQGQTIAGQQTHNGAVGQANGIQQESGLSGATFGPQIIDVPLGSLQDANTTLTTGRGQLNGGADLSHGDLTLKGSNESLNPDIPQNQIAQPGALTEVSPDTSGSSPQAKVTATSSEQSLVVRTINAPVVLPDNSLFILNAGTDSHYLVETDPRFTNQKKWLSSADIYSPDQLQKRLGDGYYEQRLIRNQITQATGMRYLDGYSDDETQYRDLLNSGKAFGERYGIRPGVALSPDQMGLLTSDIVWMVNQTVTLPDGSTQVVSVPQLYVRVKPGDLNGNGALLSGRQVEIRSNDDVINSGVIKGQQMTSISANNFQNQGVVSGQNVGILATGDIVNRGGQLIGGDKLSLHAGHDILSLTDGRQNGAEGWLDRKAGIYVQNDGGELSLKAVHDIHLTASEVVNQGKQSQTTLIAGNDLKLDTQKVSHATDYTLNGKNYDRTHETQEIGSQINVGGNLTLTAGRDMTLRAADVVAGGALTAQAGRDMTLESGEATWDHSGRSKWTSSGFLSTTTHEHIIEEHQLTAQGTTLSGETVSAGAGRDMTLSGANVAGTGDVSLAAGNNLNITTADEANHQSDIEKKKKSGLMSTGGLGFTVGSASQKTSVDAESNVKKGSVVGSSTGSVSLSAGNTVTVHGSDLVAGQDLNIRGKDIAITAAENSHTELTKTESKTGGLTLALSGSAGSALNTAVQQGHDAGREEDSRLSALKGVQAALSGVSAGQMVAKDILQGNDPENNNTVGLSLSYGSQSSKSEHKVEQHTASGSSLTAGRDIILNATEGDITAQGAKIQAGHDTALDAARDIVLESAGNRETLSGKNSSHGGSVGAGVGAGSGGFGLSVSASGSSSRGHENGTTLTHTETTIDSGSTVKLHSGRDTMLTGAQVSGDKIVVDTGRDLTISSQQDSDRYDSKQSGMNAGGSVNILGAGNSGSVNASRDKLHSRFDSVKEQSGLFAGEGGFDVQVGSHTQLNGGVIASTSSAENNKLSTGTLGFEDIHNRADYSSEHQGAGVSTGGGGVNGQFVGNLANNMLAGVNHGGHDSSTTHAAVSEGTTDIRDKAHQQQDISDLSRDPEHAANGLSAIFDKEKEQKRLQQGQLIGEIGTQVSDIVRTQGELNGLSAAKKAHPELKDDVNALQKTDTYRNVMKQWGTGSDLQRGLQAATAAIQGLAGGDWQAAATGALSPYIANIIGRSIPDDNLAGRTIAHAVVNAALAAAQGSKGAGIAAGAAGAATGEVMGALLADQIYGRKPSELTESEKQTVSALATAAAGLAGGLAGDSTGNALAGAQAGKTTVENNFLGATSSDRLDKAVDKIKQGDKSLAAANELLKLENADKRSDALVEKFSKDPSQMTSTERAELTGYLRIYAAEMEKEYSPAVSQELVKGLLSGQDYMKRNPDSEAMAKAQTIINTWGYHTSNASIGDAPLLFGSSVLGTTIKEGMALNAAIGVGVNSAAQLSGKDPFSYVDAIMAGVTAAATTGKGLVGSAGINMGGAAIGSGIKGEDPTNSVIGTGLGSVLGSGTGKIISGALGSTVKEGTSDIISNIGGSITSEAVGNTVKGTLDEADKSVKK